MTTLVKNKKGHIYVYHGEQKYTNLTTGKKGIVPDEDAKRFFTIPVILNKMAMDNPLVVDLIEALNAKIETPDDML